VKTKKGDFPIHSAAYDRSSFSTYIPFLAKAGIWHVVGGETGRGGIAVKDSDEYVGCRYRGLQPGNWWV
jgi:hypothetical protein